MEIWNVQRNVWVKEAFTTGEDRRPVEDFSDSTHPPLCEMVLGEVRKNAGHRFIVFSPEEGRRIHYVGSMFLTPEREEGHALFLRYALRPVRECYRKGFSVIYIDPENTLSLNPPKGSARLAIMIPD